MQHEVYVNPAPRTRQAFPFVAVLQADIAGEGRGRMVALMAPRAALTDAAGRLLPVVRLGDQEFHLAIEAMTSVPTGALRDYVGSIARHREEITPCDRLALHRGMSARRSRSRPARPA
jgi:hypothetical protein